MRGDPRRSVRANIGEFWLFGLIGLLGVFEILMAVRARPATTMAIGIFAGMILVIAALLAKRRKVLLAAFVTLTFSVITWWTIVTPLVTLTAFGLALLTRPAGPRLK